MNTTANTTANTTTNTTAITTAITTANIIRGLGYLVITACVGLASVSQARNVTMFGGNSLAKECFDHSKVAALTGTASRTDIETCNEAIFHGELSLKDLVATYVNRGIVHMAMEDYKAAARDYNKALGLADDVGEAYVNRGNLWFAASRLTEAVEDYNRALEFGIEKPHVAHLNRGMAYEQMGELEFAKEDYQQALTLIAEWPAAQQRLERVKGKLYKKKLKQDSIDSSNEASNTKGDSTSHINQAEPAKKT